MKQIVILIIIFSGLGCNNTEEEVSYIYSSKTLFDTNNHNDTVNVDNYTKKYIKFIKDSILIKSYELNQKFNRNILFTFKYIRDGNSLYRINLNGEKKLFFTTEHKNNVYFPVIFSNPRVYSDYEEEVDELLDGSNYRFISEVKLKDNLTNDSITVNKFFVRFSRVDNGDMNYLGENDYYYYYDKNFILFKKEYIGSLNFKSQTERINYLSNLPNSLFKSVKVGFYSFE